MWTWRILNAAVSYIALYWFALKSTLLLHFPVAFSLPRRPCANNVSNITQASLRVQHRNVPSIPDGAGAPQSPKIAITSCEQDWNGNPPPIHQRKVRYAAVRQLDNPTAAADQSASETTTLVLPTTKTLDVGGSAATRSAVWTVSSSGELTRASDYATTAASDASGALTEAAASVMADPTSSIPAETDVTTTGFSSTITQPPASISTSATSTPSSEDRPISSSATQSDSTSQFPSASSETSLTDQESNGISSTEVSTTTSSLSSTDTSTSSVESSTSPTSTPSATAAGTIGSSLPPRTTTITTTITKTASSHWTTTRMSTTHATGTSSTTSSSTTRYVITTSRKCWANPIGTTCPPRITSTSTTLIMSSTTSIWMGASSPSNTSSVTLSSAQISTSSTHSCPPSSGIATSRTGRGFPATAWSPTIPVVETSSSSRQGTSSTTVTTGALRTDVSNLSSFAQNTGAIIGVSLAGTLVLVCLVLFLFFVCRRYRKKTVYNGSTDNILALAREVSWRRPVDGDDDSYAEKPQSHPVSGSLDHSGDGTHEGFASTSAGHGTTESGNATLIMPMNTVFGGQTPMPGLDHSIQGAPTSTSTTRAAAFLSEPINSHDGPHASSNAYRHFHAGGSRSVASLTLAGESSSSPEGTGWSSTSEENGRPNGRRKSLAGPRPLTSQTGRRHSSTPPTAFTSSMHQPPDPFDYERQTPPPEHSDRMSVRSFISRLRNGRRMSAQSMSTTRGPSFSQSRGPDMPDLPSVAVFSPSLLNPPVTISPSRPILTFPRGITGNSYYPLGSETVDGPRDTSGPTPVLWPAVTLPPSPTDNSSMVEGLLHPRLGLGQGQSHQASLTSLRDHEDYSRPISGLVNHHFRSTTTFDTQDTTESEGGKE